MLPRVAAIYIITSPLIESKKGMKDMAQSSMAEKTEALETLWTRWCYVDDALKAMLVRSPQLVKGTIAKADESLKHFKLKIALTKQGEVWLGRETDKAVFTPHCPLHSREDLDQAQAQVAAYNAGIVSVEDEEFVSAFRTATLPLSVF